jgi:hypothetical protein
VHARDTGKILGMLMDDILQAFEKQKDEQKDKEPFYKLSAIYYSIFSDFSYYHDNFQT